MKTKRQILSIFLILLFSIATQAQPSAQATMNVSVRIVSGITATCNTVEPAFSQTGFKGELGTISLKGTQNSQLLISNDSEITLVNKEGHQVEIPVTMRNTINAGNPKVTFSADISSPNKAQLVKHHQRTTSRLTNLEKRGNQIISKNEEYSDSSHYTGVYYGTLSTTIEYF